MNNNPKIDAGLDINTPKIGIPGLDIYEGKIGGDIDIKGPKLDIPKIGLDIKGPQFGVNIPGGIKGAIEDNVPLNIRQILSADVNALLF